MSPQAKDRQMEKKLKPFIQIYEYYVGIICLAANKAFGIAFSEIPCKIYGREHILMTLLSLFVLLKSD